MSFDAAGSGANVFQSVVIKSLPNTGSLTFNNNPVTVGQEIATASLSSLVFTPVQYNDQTATFKLIGGVLLFPLSYAVAVALLAWWGGWKAVALGTVLLPLSGWAALRVAEERQRLLEGVQALSLAFASGKALRQIRRQRRQILESVSALIREHPPEAAALR